MFNCLNNTHARIMVFSAQIDETGTGAIFRPLCFNINDDY